MLSEIKRVCALLQMAPLACDHICYRVETLERYELLKIELAQIAMLAAETPVNGRPICIFTLHEPLVFEDQLIPCVELPAPKAASVYAEGWEHAEYVTGMPLDEFRSRHPDVSFDLRAANKKINPEIALKVGDRYQAKFHTASILEVIELETRLGLVKDVREC